MSSASKSLTIEVRFFASLKDKTGTERVRIQLPHQSTIEQVIGHVAALYPQLESHLPTSLAAINQEFAFRTDVVSNGDEVALFPPVSGGSDSYPEVLSITENKLDVDDIIASITLPETGAICVFAGAVRGFDTYHEDSVETINLFYESYAEMANVKLRQVAQEIRTRYPKVQGMAIIQRIGMLNRGETTILVACASGHRNDGCFDAAKYGIDRVKEIVPIWKKEIRVSDAQWIEGSYIPVPADMGSPDEASVRRSSTRQSTEPFSVVCGDCGSTAQSLQSQLNCEKCGGAFVFSTIPRFSPGDISPNHPGMWRYSNWLVPSGADVVTLGEGWTPLINVVIGGRSVHLKLEFLNPTGSFKDRGAAVLVSMLREWSVNRAHDDSSGNAGAAFAAYSAKAGIRSTLFVPRSASKQKLAQMKLFGANLKLVDGSRRDAELNSAEFGRSGKSFYASHIWNPYSVFAYRTIAYEIWEQLDRSAPDAVILPIGHGTQLLGISAGFDDLLRAGQIKELPKLYGVQSAASSPIADLLHGAKSAGGDADTVAEGIRISHPIRAKAVSEAIVRSHGDIIKVDDNAIIDGITKFAKMGLLIEPTSAVVWKALHKVSEQIQAPAKIVVTLTGSGQKVRDLDKLIRKRSSAPLM